MPFQLIVRVATALLVSTLVALTSCSDKTNPANSAPSIPLTCRIDSVSPETGTAPLVVKFSGGASGGKSPYTYHWQFGDQNSSEIAGPTHTYQAAGQYTVVYTVEDAGGGSCTKDTTVTVTATPRPDLIVASGSPVITPTSIEVGGSFRISAGSLRNSGSAACGQFTMGFYISADAILSVTDTRVGGATVSGLAAGGEFAWADQNFILSASIGAGTYYIGVLADENGSVTEANESNNSACRQVTVVAVAALTCSATASHTVGTAPLSVTFTASASGGRAPYTYSWQFGDQSTSTLQNPTHVYSQAGVYTARLTVTDANSATCTKTISITAVPPGLTCTVSANPTSGPAPLQVTFHSTVTGGTAPYHYAWTFGDGDTSLVANPTHTYTRRGTYTVNFAALDSRQNGCAKTLTISVTTGAALSCTASGAPSSGQAPLTVSFTSSTSGGTAPYSYSWNFGDGSTVIGSQNPTHTYSTPGTFTARMDVTDAQNATCSKTVVVTVTAASLNCSASATPTTGAAPLTVSFTGTASAGQAPYSYMWQFGDGGSSSQQNPSHIYNAAGTYTATLTVGDAASGNCSKNVTITVTGTALNCTASASPASGPAPLAVSFTGGATGGQQPYSYAWNFGDGGTSTLQSPSHTYQSAGSYTATVTVTDSRNATCQKSVAISATQAATGPVLSGPSNATASFTLTWTFSWPPLMNSNDKVSVERSITGPNSGYSVVAEVYRSQGSSLVIANPTQGTHYYRCRAWVSLAGQSQWSQYSNVLTVVVTAPVSKTRFNNNSTYFIVSLKIDNVEQFPASPLGMLPGYYYEKELAPGSHSWEALYGFWNEYGGREYLYRYWGTYTQRSGVTEQINLVSPTIAQLLTKFQSTGTWSAWVPGYFNKVVFRFNSNGTFTFTNLQGGTSTGTYTFVSRNGTNWTVVFSAGGYQATLWEFGDFFTMNNGPGGATLQYFYDGP
ncbi:MAG: PKD domain-containing protein [Candidatus Zixiibacteriota bacterium]